MLKSIGIKARFRDSFNSIMLSYLVNLGLSRIGEFARAAALAKKENLKRLKSGSQRSTSSGASSSASKRFKLYNQSNIYELSSFKNSEQNTNYLKISEDFYDSSSCDDDSSFKI